MYDDVYDQYDDENNPFGSRFSDEGLAEGHIEDKLWAKYLVTFIIAFAISAILFVLLYFVRSHSVIDSLSTAFFISGLLSLSTVANSLIRRGQSARGAMEARHIPYNADPSEARKEIKSRGSLSRVHWLVVGLLYMALGIAIPFAYDFILT